MINARAARRFKLEGKTYAKGDHVSLPQNQFDDLAAVGRVERVTPPPMALAGRIAQAVVPRSPVTKTKPAASPAGRRRGRAKKAG